jgi:hypothetical protein
MTMSFMGTVSLAFLGEAVPIVTAVAFGKGATGPQRAWSLQWGGASGERPHNWRTHKMSWVPGDPRPGVSLFGARASMALPQARRSAVPTTLAMLCMK